MSHQQPNRRETLASIEQSGANASQARHSWQANPYLRRENMPSQTGESFHDWSRKHDAWQSGFERDDEKGR